ncbi:hypothetical protein C8Q79DRAFT_927481 [Trametes meyenii]|nr:hypothetical protein C8Q79DRAFT_927481 [Trametes meyenii]
MYNKITCISYRDFMDEFLPEFQARQTPGPQEPPNADTSYRQSHLRSRGKPSLPSEAGSIPNRKPPQSPFKGMPTAATEKEMYTNITAALNAMDLCPGYQFVPTPHKSDQFADIKQAVDCGMYLSDIAKKLTTEGQGNFGRTAWSWVEISIECKMNAVNDDPFNEDLEGHEPNAETRRHVLGQILSYAEYVFNHQQRMFQYMLLFLGDYARIVRIDRAGIFITKKFSYKRTYGGRIAEFLQHYAARSPADRGHDTTAVRLDPKSGDAGKMRARVKQVDEDDYVAALFKKQLRDDWPWWKLEVPDELTGETRRYLVGKPHFQAPGVAGRATRGYVALEAEPVGGQKARFVYLKDAWRVVSDDIDKEGTVLQELRAHQVPCVPTLICHGDIPRQRTRTQEVWPKHHPGKECSLKTHQHYRVVVEEIGKPLEEFSNGFQLVQAFLCCVTAHSRAYAHGIIHRDISVGNMLLYKRPGGTWQGLLNDWELSKHLEQQEPGGRQPDRTGTWQFMSVNALNKHTKPIVIQDELESFFHVLLYLCIRFLYHNLDDSSVPQFMRDYFDDFAPHKTGYRCGPRKDKVITSGTLDLSPYNEELDESLHFLCPTKPGDTTQSPTHPIDDVFATLLSWFSAHYTIEARKDKSKKRDKNVHGANHEIMDFVAQLRDERRRAEKMQGAEDVSTTQSTRVDVSVDTVHSVQAEEGSEQEQDTAVVEELAAKLKTHDATISLLLDVLSEGNWPESDRRKDLKPTKWKPQIDQVQKASRITKNSTKGGSKKGSAKGSATSSKSSKVLKAAQKSSKVSAGSKRSIRDADNAEAGPSTKRRKR